MFDMNMDIQHLMEACDKSSGACSYNGKKKGNDANTNDPSSNEGCCKKEVCPTTNEGCKNEGCKRESSIFDGPFQALDEFKHDIEASYSVKRAAEKLSGDHNIGKAATTASKVYTSGSSGNYGGETGRNSRGYVRSKVDASNVKKYADAISNNKNAAKAARGVGGYISDTQKDMKRANKMSNRGVTGNNIGESPSIFDSLFSQI